MSDDDLVRVAGYGTDLEAGMAQDILQENGINSTLNGADTGAGFSLNIDGSDGVEVIVRAADLDKAKKLLEGLTFNKDEKPAPAWTCKCGEEVDEGFGVCWSCGAEFEG